MTHLAQFNIARARWPLDDPRMADFTNNTARINALAARSPGFVWRMSDEEEHGPDGPDYSDDPLMTFTLSVWKDIESLRHFTWNTLHKKFRLRTAEWFEPLGAAYLVLWPIEEGRRPTGPEAQAKLDHLRRHGPSPEAFGTEALTKEPA